MNVPRTALVVDDEDQLLRLMARVIERGGGQALTAKSGDEARRIFREKGAEIGVVLLDITMPGGDGARKLMPEFIAERPDLRVIITSGDALPQDLEADLQRIGGRFLQKPFVPKTLIRMLEESRPASGAPAQPLAPGPV